jgi:uncharacterized protein with HEPN domain
MKDDRIYLIDMLEIARRIEKRMARLTRAEFDASEDVQLALTHLLQVIGEAARCVSEESRAKFTSIDWKIITGMRHRIVHDYMHVNIEMVWQTAHDDVPFLIAQLAPVVDPIIAEAKSRKGKSN